jgi:hypothetical protein
LETESNANSKAARIILYALVITLVTEGLWRKFIPAGATVLFFLKDLLVAVLGFFVFRRGFLLLSPELTKKYALLVAGFSMLILWTAMKSPLLAIFGGKQYLLFPIVAFGTILAFEDADQRSFFNFFQFFGYLVLGTCMLALLQLKLPEDHILNSAIGGTSLGSFSAGGKLRVCSSFSFVSQFIMFQNAATALIGMMFFFRQRTNYSGAKFLLWAIIPALILATFATGSRGAVFGNALVIVVAGAILAFKGNSAIKGRFVFAVVSLVVFLMVTKIFFPDAFEAYKARSGGTEDQSHVEEVISRIWSMLTGWTGGLQGAPPKVFGYGLGVMSNGADQVSQYAASWRNEIWGESDLPNTLFEGGWYLILIWYSFRIWVLVFTLRIIFKIRDPLLVGAASFAGGHVLMQGSIATLGIHPPVAIWFWLTVGLVFALRDFEIRESNRFKFGLPDQQPEMSRPIPRILGPPPPKALENARKPPLVPDFKVRRKPRDSSEKTI